MASSDMQYTGHAGNGGLQRHSLGDIYPWAIIRVGDKHAAFNCETGEEGPHLAGYEKASQWLRGALILRSALH